MQIVDWQTILDKGSYSVTDEYRHVRRDVIDAMEHTVWPDGSDIFTIYPESGKKTGQGNGVKPIKLGFTSYLEDHGWTLEERFGKGRTKGSHPGAFDCHYRFPYSDVLPFAVEWETGNISSSHRAINRMALGILEGQLSGGLLMVPSEKLARYLTDRVGNSPELQPYIPLWQHWEDLAPSCYLGIVTFEQDAESIDVPRIPKGTDGRARI